MPTYHSQVDQDRILNDVVFCGMRNGVLAGRVVRSVYPKISELRVRPCLANLLQN
jgi:hypothetical protein